MKKKLIKKVLIVFYIGVEFSHSSDLRKANTWF